MTLLRHIALRCRDMDRSRGFYETAFGWKFLGYRTARRGADLTDGTHNITLIQQPSDDDRPRLPDGQEYIHIGLIVEDLAACRRRLEELGAVFATDRIKSTAEPAQSFKVLDPDGNVVDVTANRDEWLGVTI